MVKLNDIQPDYYNKVAQGMEGHSFVHKFGRNKNSVATFETVWSEGGVYSYASSATVMRISSDSANDATAGVGALTVEIQGLDNDYVSQSETIALSGTTPVTLTNSYLRVFRMIVKSAGASASNSGKIYLWDNGGTQGSGIPTTTTNIFATIDTATAQTLMAIYTVPASTTGYLIDTYGSVDKGKDMQLEMFRRPQGEVFQLKESITLYENFGKIEHKLPIPISEKTDIEVRASSSASSANVNAGFDLLLVDNRYL